MNYFKVTKKQSGGGGGTLPKVYLEQSYTQSGSSTYTVTTSGMYMLIVSNSLQGSRSITLPQGRTAIIDEDIEPSSGSIYGSTVVIANLQAGDEVTLNATPDSWAAFSKQVYRLEDVSISSVYGTQANVDGHYSYTMSGSSTYILVGICFGRTAFDYYDESDIRAYYGLSNNTPDNCTLTKICIGTGSEIGEQELYGYDGGGVDFIAINATW